MGWGLDASAIGGTDVLDDAALTRCFREDGAACAEGWRKDLDAGRGAVQRTAGSGAGAGVGEEGVMNEPLRFAEAVCEGHPDRLADRIAARIVDFACRRDGHALVGVEVAIHRNVVFIDGRIAAGNRPRVRGQRGRGRRTRAAVFGDAGYGRAPSGTFIPVPDRLDVRVDLCLGPLGDDERAVRHVSDDQAIAVGHAVQGARAGYRPLEQALANDCVAAIESLRRVEAVAWPRPGRQSPGRRARTGARRPVGVSAPRPRGGMGRVDRAVRDACEAVAREYVEAGGLEPMHAVGWLINGAGAFEIGGPEGDNGLSGKKLVAQAYGTAVPIGGGATFGKDPRKVDPRGQRMAREMALELVTSGKVREATVWLAWRPAMSSRNGSRSSRCPSTKGFETLAR